jgi:hypothetical protein
MAESMCSTESGNAKGLKDIMQPRYEEIQRRKDIPSIGADDMSHFSRVKDGSSDSPYVDGNQSVVLFSVSSEKMYPRCRDPSQPGLMIVGVFPDSESAVSHAASLPAVQNYQTQRTHTWTICFRDAFRLSDPSLCEKSLQDLIRAKEEEEKRNRREFEENVRGMKTGSVPTKAKDDYDSSKEGRDVKNLKPVASNTMACIRGQTHAVVCFLLDTETTEYPEFGIKVLRICDSQEAADRYVRNVASVHITDMDIHVVETCAWLFPQMLLTDVVPNEQFRHEELHKVMANQKCSTSEARAFDSANSHMRQKKEGAPDETLVDVVDKE